MAVLLVLHKLVLHERDADVPPCRLVYHGQRDSGTHTGRLEHVTHIVFGANGLAVDRDDAIAQHDATRARELRASEAGLGRWPVGLDVGDGDTLLDADGGVEAFVDERRADPGLVRAAA